MEHEPRRADLPVFHPLDTPRDRVDVPEAGQQAQEGADAMTESEQTQLEIDAWERRRQRLKSFFIEKRGMSSEEADERATDEIRQAIIESQ